MTTPSSMTERTRQLLYMTGLLALAAVVRFRFLDGRGVAEFDPWRHLTLIDNLRKGAGFTLFDGQPYIWYNSIWYRLAALFGPPQDSAFLSSALCLVSLGIFYWFLLRTERSSVAAIAGGLMIAAYGPVVTFTGGYGSESLAFLLVLLSYLLATFQPNLVAVVGAGLAFGIALLCRINFVFAGLLVWPLLKDMKERVVFGAAAGIVLAIGAWNTAAVIGAYPYLFTWDGMATRSSDYTLISTIAPQLNSSIAAATRELYQRAASLPLDFASRGPMAAGNVVFVVLATMCVFATMRAWLIVASVVPLTYFLFLDSTLSTNFYRHFLAVFPPLFIGIAVVSSRLAAAARDLPRMATFGWPGLVLILILSGWAYLQPIGMPTINMVTPTPAALTGDRYMVNSGLYHPESLIHRYPDKKFIGMPYDPAEFEEFAKLYPDYTRIIWHREFSVQDKLLTGLVESGRYRLANTASDSGLAYVILEKRP